MYIWWWGICLCAPPTQLSSSHTIPSLTTSLPFFPDSPLSLPLLPLTFFPFTLHSAKKLLEFQIAIGKSSSQILILINVWPAGIEIRVILKYPGLLTKIICWLYSSGTFRSLVVMWPTATRVFLPTTWKRKENLEARLQEHLLVLNNQVALFSSPVTLNTIPSSLQFPPLSTLN